MSETLFKFLLAELKTVRIVCKGKKAGKDCRHIIELPLSSLGNFTHCPNCKEDFRDQNKSQNRLEELRDAIGNVQNLETHFDVEFVLPQK